MGRGRSGKLPPQCFGVGRDGGQEQGARAGRSRSRPPHRACGTMPGAASGTGAFRRRRGGMSRDARKGARTPRSSQPAPSTPPPKSTPLPSSMMNTPGGSNAGFLGFGATTPGPSFNFSDYLNVTPSPAQAAWRTPAAVAKTPLTARDATRRRLNFDALVPPTSGSGDTKLRGLGMELGGELVSSQ